MNKSQTINELFEIENFKEYSLYTYILVNFNYYNYKINNKASVIDKKYAIILLNKNNCSINEIIDNEIIWQKICDKFKFIIFDYSPQYIILI